MLAIAIAIRMDSPGKTFYKAQRIGRKGRAFPCYKFRTMVHNADKLKAELEHMNERDGVLFKIAKDPRITRVGGVLRKYSLDELPQFYNVLRGDMSLVGPRPPMAAEVEQYDLAHTLRRLDVLPGITGLWQVEARPGSVLRQLYLAGYGVRGELEPDDGFEDSGADGGCGVKRDRVLSGRLKT